MYACHSRHARVATCILHLTIDTAALTALRHDVMRLCGNAMEFMRIAVCAHSRTTRVWIGVDAAVAPAVTDFVTRRFPAAAFFSHPPERPKS